MYTKTEIMVVAAARLLEDKKGVFVGTGMPLAAASLAQKTHAPNLLLFFEAGGVGPRLPRIPISVGEMMTYHEGVEAGTMDLVMGTAAKGLIEYGFLGGAQIDKYGNLNSTVIGDYINLKVRFPGSGGANDVGSLCRKLIIIMKHEKRRFVEKVDFLTTPGYIMGPGTRERVGLPKDSGPYRVISTLGIMGFHPESKEMMLLEVYPGVDVEEVKEQTGFSLIIPDDVKVMEPPTEEELRILHEEVDPLRYLSRK